MLSAVGVAADVAFHIGGLLTTLLAFGSLAWLAFTPATADNQVRGIMMLLRMHVRSACVSGCLFVDFGLRQLKQAFVMPSRLEHKAYRTQRGCERGTAAAPVHVFLLCRC